MAKKRPKKKHSVKAQLHVHQLSKAGTSLELQIYAYDEKLGDLTVGRGSVPWHGANRQSAKRLSWSRFAEMMDELAYGR
jgi:hypothetical protein